jgi:hypothetical protein
MKKILLLLLLLIRGIYSQYDRGNVTFNFDSLTHPHCYVYADSISYTPLVTQFVYTKINSGVLTIRDTNKITVQGDSIKVQNTGGYLCLASWSVSGGVNDDFRIRYAINSVFAVPPQGRYIFSTDGASNYVSANWFWYWNLTAGDWISFHITNETDNDDPTFRNIKYYLIKVH